MKTDVFSAAVALLSFLDHRERIFAPRANQNGDRDRCPAVHWSEVMVALPRFKHVSHSARSGRAGGSAAVTEWIHPDGHDVPPAFRDYAAPLAGEGSP